jgi:hypothetical protein
MKASKLRKNKPYLFLGFASVEYVHYDSAYKSPLGSNFTYYDFLYKTEGFLVLMEDNLEDIKEVTKLWNILYEPNK